MSDGSRSLVNRIMFVFCISLALLGGWIAFDLYGPHKNSFHEFNSKEVADLESAMWRSYYERRKARLFWQLARSTQFQYHAPFWRSFVIAYKGAKAAFVFKDGKNREDYAKVQPILEDYFADVNALNTESFEVRSVAKNELEWWIIRREPQYTHRDWERVLAEVSSGIYRVPKEHLTTYARLRVAAMALRDSQGDNITEDDWSKITDLLRESWSALAEVVRRN